MKQQKVYPLGWYLHWSVPALIKNDCPKRSQYSLVVAICCCILLMISAVLYAQKVKDAPNVIFIMADDMGYSDIGCYGGEINTPNIDLLAKEGIKFSNFYNNARCCPTRASLLTGRYPHTVGMGHMVTPANAKIQPGAYQGFLETSYHTIAEELKRAGYNTYMAGKWHVGERAEHWPLTRGFEHYFGLISGASSYYEIIPAEKDKRHVVLDDKDYPIPAEGFYMTDAFTDHALQYLDKQKNKSNSATPFFLYLAYTAPHFPLHSYESDIKKYEKLYLQGWDITREKRWKKMEQLGLADKRYHLTDRPADIPDWNSVSDKKQWARKMAVYAAMIDRMDQNIGRLISRLKANGQYENTLIIFLSDNGGCAENVSGRNFNDSSKQIGERGSYVTYDMPWANVSNTPFKRYKSFLHEGGIVTPFIMHWPAKIKPRTGYISDIGHVIDLLPTCLELADLPAKDLPGESLSFLWQGKKPLPKTYCWEHEGNAAIRKGKWKLVKDLVDPAWELYNLETDPCEANNIATAYPQQVKDMELEYRAWAKKVGVCDITNAKNKAE